MQEHINDNYIVLTGLPETMPKGKDETPKDTKTKVDNLLTTVMGTDTFCTSASRMGTRSSRARRVKIYFLSQDDRNRIFYKKKQLPRGHYINSLEPENLSDAKRRLRYKRKILKDDNIEATINYKTFEISYEGVTTHWSEISLPERESNRMDISSFP